MSSFIISPNAETWKIVHEWLVLAIPGLTNAGIKDVPSKEHKKLLIKLLSNLQKAGTKFSVCFEEKDSFVWLAYKDPIPGKIDPYPYLTCFLINREFLIES
jgi:hypothetical protein